MWHTSPVPWITQPCCDANRKAWALFCPNSAKSSCWHPYFFFYISIVCCTLFWLQVLLSAADLKALSCITAIKQWRNTFWYLKLTFPVPLCRVRGGKEDPLSQVPLSAGWKAHEEDFCLQRQRLHAAVRSAGQEARVLVLCATGKVSAASSNQCVPYTNQVSQFWCCSLLPCNRLQRLGQRGRPLPNTWQSLAELQNTPPPLLWIFETNKICILCQAPTTLMASVYLPLLSPPDSKINDLLFIHSGGKWIHTLSLHTGPMLQWGSASLPFECSSPT